MPLAIQSRRVGYVTVVDCAGKLVAGENSDSLQEQVRRCIETHIGVIVNLGAVTFIDSSGLGLLVRLAVTTRNSPAGLRFCGANEQIQKVLELTKLGGVLNIYDTEERAMQSFASKVAVASPAGVGANVLCVDQSMDLLAYLRGALDRAGFRTHSARTVPDAILLLRTIRPDAVVAGPEFALKVGALAAEMKVPLICLDEEFSSLDAGDAIGTLLEQIRAQVAQGNA